MLEATTAPRIAVVGGGKMGEAILAGWIRSTHAPADAIGPDDVVAVDPGEDRRAHLESAHGVSCVADVSQLPDAVPYDIVVLSVKPQVMFEVLEQAKSLPAFGGAQDGPLFVSIAAGLTTDSIASALPSGSRVVRVMPNMPLMVGAGASGVCAGPGAAERDVALVADLFGCLGRAVVVEEADMDAVCAVSGSGPAYVAAMIEAMRDAAAARGLGSDLAETLALQTVLGTALLISDTDLTVAEARQAVCSPGGTTLAALEAMYDAGFREVFDKGIDAAVRRAKELAKC